MREKKSVRFVLLAVLTTMVLMPVAAQAGPPLICHPVEIGGAKSLPWTADLYNLSGRDDYDLSRLVTDTLAILVPGTPVLVRMETLRRASIYAQKDSRVSKELLSKLYDRATSSEAKGRSDSLAWFDLGYLVECYKQANWDYKKHSDGTWEKNIKPNPAAGLDGYAWVNKAISLRGADPEMELAAAMITLDGPREACRAHLQKATEGTKSDSLLAKNLEVRSFARRGETIGNLFASVIRETN